MTFTEDDFSEAPREYLQEGTNGLDNYESSVNHFHLISLGLLFLELRGKYNLRTLATCCISEKPAIL